jgi:hypothetical protein
MRSVENELKKCFYKFQERLLMAGYDVEFTDKDKIIERVSEPILDVIASAIFSNIIVEIFVKPEDSAHLVGKFLFGNSMDFIEDVYFQMNDYYNSSHVNRNYIEFSFFIYDREVYEDVFSKEEGAPSMSIDEEIIDEHIENIKNILKAYEIEPEYDSVINAVTFRIPLEVEVIKYLV